MPFQHTPIKIVFFFQLKIFSVEKRNMRSGDPPIKHLLKRKNGKKESLQSGCMAGLSRFLVKKYYPPRRVEIFLSKPEGLDLD
jgi:hypothetical protein